jgi:hypothetical protein
MLILELYRCYSCKKLWLNKFYLKKAKCDCGDNRLTKSSPSSIIEKFKVFWWELTVR